MRFLKHRPINHSQWDVYRQLELISTSIPNPADQSSRLTSGLNLLWRPLLDLLMAELVAEQQVEYLDRCWSLNELDEGDQSPANSLQRLWTLMN